MEYKSWDFEFRDYINSPWKGISCYHATLWFSPSINISNCSQSKLLALKNGFTEFGHGRPFHCLNVDSFKVDFTITKNK